MVELNLLMDKILRLILSFWQLGIAAMFLHGSRSELNFITIFPSQCVWFGSFYFSIHVTVMAVFFSSSVSLPLSLLFFYFLF